MLLARIFVFGFLLLATLGPLVAVCLVQLAECEWDVARWWRS